MRTKPRLPIFASLLLTCCGASSFAATLVVGNTGASPTCPPAYSTIQAAVNHAQAGDKIYVCNTGVPYNEQVTVSTSSIAISGQQGAMVRPGPMVENTTSLSSGFPIAAAILVSGATAVTISDLIVDGSASGLSDCSIDPIGIYYQNSSGTVAYNAVRGFEISPQPNGCQGGLGIFVQSGGSGTSTVTVFSNSVHDFQKNGITANETGTTVTVVQNAVTGVGVSPAIAQNGIQIGFGAAGSVGGNVVTNVVYGPCTSTSACDASSTGILIYDAATVATNNNTINTTQGGIYYFGSSGGTISGNNVSNTLVWDGIAVSDDGATPGGNHTIDKDIVSNSGESNVWVGANNNNITNGTLSETPIGIWFASGTGNSQSVNKFYTTPIPVQNGTPPVAAHSGPVSGVRPKPVR